MELGLVLPPCQRDPLPVAALRYRPAPAHDTQRRPRRVALLPLLHRHPHRPHDQYHNHHLAGRQRRGRVARPTSFAPGPSSAGGFWDRASEASAEASCASVHAAQAFAPSLNPRPQASASARVALYSRSPSSLPSLVDRNQSSKPGHLVSGIPSTPKTPRRRRRRREARRASCRPGPAVTRREMVAVQEE